MRASIHRLLLLLLGFGPLACARHTTLEDDASSSNASSRMDAEQAMNGLPPLGVGGRAAGDPGCFAGIDGTSAPSALALGPNNRVFQPAHVRPDAGRL